MEENSATMAKPVKIPLHCRRAGPLPYLMAEARDVRFAGPGVIADTAQYSIKDGIIFTGILPDLLFFLIHFPGKCIISFSFFNV